jgi:hypothetical protein
VKNAGRALLIFVSFAIPLAAQTPSARLTNQGRAGATDFQVGDRFEVVITGGPNQPVSVRTSRQGRTDFSPVIGWTDLSGRWSVTGEFEKADFGGWYEAWTVGSKLANPVIGFSVNGPCLPGGRASIFTSGPNLVLNCDTATGRQTFGTPSFGDSFRTPDGRVVPAGTPQQIMASLIENAGGLTEQRGDDAGALITKTIGANALNEREIRNILSIIGHAYQNRMVVPPTLNPATLELLQRLSSATDQESLKKEIAETMAFVQMQ